MAAGCYIGGRGRARRGVALHAALCATKRNTATYCLRQLLANACIAASIVASWPRVGVRPSWKLYAKVYDQ